MRVSEKVTVQEINQWKDGDIITIKAGCGAGKSYFIKNILYAIAKRDNKKILMLIHRSNCVNQFLTEIELDDLNKLEYIDIKTYQDLEAKDRYKKPINLDEYGYIISDEFHYFMSDASFNKFTDISLNLILAASNQIRIFMSATGDYMTSYISNVKKQSTINYELPINYKFIKHLEFFHQEGTIHKYIKLAIENNVKGIFFIESAKKAYELHKQYPEHSLFNCSKSNNEYYQYVDKDKIDTMLKNEKFDELFLFTTTCMDAGVNIVDDDLHDIVVDVGLDIGQIIQSIGRKRLKNSNDYVNVHIKSISNKQLGGKETQLKKRVEMADYFRMYGANSYVDKFYREVDRYHIVYDHPTSFGYEKRLNNLMYFNVKTTLAEVDKMKYFGEWGFCKYVADYFDIKSYYIAEDEVKTLDLENYLESVVGKILYSAEQDELKEKFKTNGLKARTMGINTLNGNLKDRKLPYIINSETDNRRNITVDEVKVKNPHFRKVYWIVGKITY